MPGTDEDLSAVTPTDPGAPGAGNVLGPANARESEAPGNDERYTEDPGEKRVLGFEPILIGRIARLSIPVIIGMITQTLINQIDLAFIGRLDDETAVVAGSAALVPAQIMLWAIGGFLSAISVGTQALTARRWGEGDANQAGRVLTNSATVATIASILATVVAYNIAGPLFALNSEDATIREVGTSYLEIRYLGLFSMVLMASYKSFYDGVGRVRIHMTIAIVMNLVNAVLNYFLIFGKAGFPQLGVDGAAWSSVISSVTGIVLMVGWSLRKSDRKVFRVYNLRNLDWGIAKSVTSLSLWSGLAIFFAMTGFWMFFKIVELGAEDVRVAKAAAGVVTSVGLICFMTCIAYGTATATLISQSLGAKKPDLAYRYGLQSLMVMVLFMAGLGALTAIFPEQIVQIFVKSEPGATELLKQEVIATAARSLRICSIGGPMAAFSLVTAQALYGAGESRFVMIVEGALHFTCLVPVAYLFAVTFELGLLGCWLAMGVYGIGLISAMGWKFFGKSWTKTVI